MGGRASQREQPEHAAAGAAEATATIGRCVPAGAILRVRSGFFQGLELPLDRAWLVIGRGRTAELVLAEPTISRAHAAIGYDGCEFFVQDLRSTNGTLVNGERLDRSPLTDHDEIQIGKLQLEVSLPKTPTELLGDER